MPLSLQQPVPIDFLPPQFLSSTEPPEPHTAPSPHRLNALSEAMGESLLRLADYLAAAPADQVRACIVYGGTRAFSTGRDLKVRSARENPMACGPHSLSKA